MYCLQGALCIERIAQNYLCFSIQVIKTVTIKDNVSYASFIKLLFYL